MTLARRPAYGIVVALVVALALLLNYQAIFRGIGGYLVDAKPPEKADAILVLAGDPRGDRIATAAKLVRDGYAPIALVSGPMELYGLNEADLAVQFAVRQGAPASYFEAVHVNATSTLEEAKAFIPELRRRNVHRLLLVTSNFHTRRAGGIFRSVFGPSVDVRMVAAPDKYFQPDTWWHNREGQKTVFYEYSKTLAGWLGM